MRSLRFLLPAFLTAAAVALPATASAVTATTATVCPGAALQPSAANAPAVRSATLCLLNHERAIRGLPRLRAQPTLSHVATAYAGQMVRQHFFDHTSPGGSTMVARVKHTTYLRTANGWSLGENLAWGEGSTGTPQEIVDAWMHSAPHRRNILDGTFREIGLGVAVGVPGSASAGATYVNEFGRRG